MTLIADFATLPPDLQEEAYARACQEHGVTNFHDLDHEARRAAREWAVADYYHLEGA